MQFGQCLQCSSTQYRNPSKNRVYDIYDQRRPRSDCAYAQSDQGLRCSQTDSKRKNTYTRTPAVRLPTLLSVLFRVSYVFVLMLALQSPSICVQSWLLCLFLSACVYLFRMHYGHYFKLVWGICASKIDLKPC